MRGIPQGWREPFDHISDCYFCAMNTTGINRKNRHSLQYPNLPSARRTVAHCEEIPVSALTQLPHIDDDDEATTSDNVGDTDQEYKTQDGPQPFSQCELNDLVRDLSLSKTSCELLASRFKEKNLLSEDARITFFRTSARRKTSCTAKMSPVFFINSALLHTIRQMGDSSLTAASAL